MGQEDAFGREFCTHIQTCVTLLPNRVTLQFWALNSHLAPIHSICVDGGFAQFHGYNEVSFKRAIDKPPETFFSYLV